MNALEKKPENRPTALEFAKAFSQEISKLQETDPEVLLVKASYGKQQKGNQSEKANSETIS
jgi:hypothetical protein